MDELGGCFTADPLMQTAAIKIFLITNRQTPNAGDVQSTHSVYQFWFETSMEPLANSVASRLTGRSSTGSIIKVALEIRFQPLAKDPIIVGLKT